MALLNDDRQRETTCFQEASPYDESTDLRTDVAIVYGLDETLPGRMRIWRERGYRVHVMTGIAWGRYRDYLYGDFDGRKHWDEAQTDADEKPILHGPEVPYMVPTLSFQRYLVEKLRPIVALGADALHLEEPELWARAGYSEAFKREWQAYFGEPWQPPHSSVDAHYRSGKLKRHLFSRCLEHVFTELRDEAVRQERDLRLYVATHSLVNYTQWQIVSPESAIAEIPACDGCIAQVWTGTARTPNVYAGVAAERTFETAFLEYGIAQELTRGSKRRMWFLHDPIEDNPSRSWQDYETNYKRTLVASLLHPGVTRYEVAPWPSRIYNSRHLVETGSETRSAIPESYATQLQITMQTLRDMDQEEVEWEISGPRIGVLLADTAMFQRWLPGDSVSEHYDGLQNDLDASQLRRLHFSSFYGLALPLLKQGQPVTPVQLESAALVPGALDGHQILVCSYELMKPPTAAVHFALAGWVRQGGGLLYCGDGSDPYHGVREWWNQAEKSYPTPAHHLFEALGADLSKQSVQRVSAGAVRVISEAPARLAESPAGAQLLSGAVEELALSLGHRWEPGNRLVLRRGPYLIGTVLTESDEGSWHLRGSYVDLLDPRLPVVEERMVRPGEVVWLRDLRLGSSNLIASASRIRDWREQPLSLSFVSEAPLGTPVRTLLRFTKRPAQVTLDGRQSSEWLFREDLDLLWIEHPGRPTGVDIEVNAG